jgi:hypothetical protein
MMQELHGAGRKRAMNFSRGEIYRDNEANNALARARKLGFG